MSKIGQGWIGVDLDGTLAYYDGWKNGAIGAPIPLMVDQVKKWLEEGHDVRIFTARVNVDSLADLDPIMNAIQAWCVEHIGQELPITFAKDMQMICLYDDRCVQVETNTGRLLGSPK